MRIAFVIETFPSTTEVAILNQVIGLIESGADVTIFTFNKSYLKEKNIHQKVFQQPLNIIELPKPAFSKYKNEWKNKLAVRFNALPLLWRSFLISPGLSWKAITESTYGETKNGFKIIYAIQPLLEQNSNFDVIHCQFGPMGLWGAILRDLGLLKGKLITSFRGYDINDLPQKTNEEIYSFLKLKGDLFTANTLNTKQNAIKLGFESNKIHIIPSSINVKEFQYLNRGYDKENEFEILTVARLTEVKGLEYAIKAMAILKNDFKLTNFRYRIVGEGELKQSLQALIDENDLHDQVILEGYHSQEALRSFFYNKAHLFILPSIITSTGNKEAQGVVLQEAQACGIPVIGTNTGGIPEGILDGKSGFIVPDKEPRSIAKVVQKILTEPLLIKQMGSEGRRFVEENFDINSVTKNLIHLYQS
ncbi:colanic acid/amylovoran biosynthesis glycosyltransferase [Gramella sp. Hel_I_59]|uniref:glycosyltransferase n=1 Tax=Gramella sp. Hel_I_59 TaxID=1249978 RepID=UPI0011514C0F|nr:glycosyltransferase [Gramella sp. Hel_I_59]TQI71946.1 colanic acid/amylovoran biosynthesis glycosyltransferase [Gramella sp. Hel_I_59]